MAAKASTKSQKASPSPATTAPTPTEDDTNAPTHRPIPDTSESPRQGPTGSPTQRKTTKPDGADRPGEGRGSLKEAAMKNVTMLGDPVSLKVRTLITYIHLPPPSGLLACAKSRMPRRRA